jgi:hypothetical protein
MLYMKLQYTRILLLNLIGWSLILGSCASPTIVIYVTPTLPLTDTVAVTPTPLQDKAVPTELPATVRVEAASVSPVAGVPTVTYIGSVLDAGYTLPSSPMPIASATPAPTSSETASSTPKPQIAALPNLDPFRMGIQLDPNLNQDDWRRALASIQRLGVKWLKVQISWKQLQPNGPDEISQDFRRLEIYLEEAYNAGLDILISVAKAPAWARSNQTEDGPPDDPQMLVRFISLMLQEFGASLDAVEVWNEPNLAREWQGQPLSGQSYMLYFAPARDAINQYAEAMKTDPKTPRSTPLYVITAGLAPTGDNPAGGSRNDRSYLQEMYRAGLGNYPDVFIGIHPYSWGNPPDATCCHLPSPPGWDDDPHFFFMNNVNDFREIMTDNGHTSNKLFVTEFGYATWDQFPGEPPQPWMAYNDRWAQGNYTIRAFQIAQSLDFVGPIILWNLNVASKGTISNRDEQAAYSITFPGNSCAFNIDSADPTERPVYWMIYDAVRPDVELPSYCS